ncbi:MAG: hypothetical protein Q8K23_20515 [Sulfuritalea sp.]|nr:hypothetical protein [Sulfuritalea sp.]
MNCFSGKHQPFPEKTLFFCSCKPLNKRYFQGLVGAGGVGPSPKPISSPVPDEAILSAVWRELSWTRIKALIYIDDARQQVPGGGES